MYRKLNIHKKPYNYLKHVGLVNDVTELPQYLTVVQLLEWILRAKHLWDEQSQANIGNLLDRLCFDERRNNLISTLSSGMSRKAQIALAPIAKPSVLLTDEPFRGLDDASWDATLALLYEFQDGGGILVLVSHLKGSLVPLCHNYLHLPV